MDDLFALAPQVRARALFLISKWQKEEVSLPLVDRYIDLFKETISGGKTIRGLLVTLGFQLNGKKENKDILDIAAAFEIVHAALLIQDDIMDKSPTRHGKPSYHYVLGADHFGLSQAMCAGDVGFMLANRIILDSNFNSTIKNKAASVFADIVLKTIIGQILDVHFTYKEVPKNEDEIGEMYKLKTAQYTVSGPLLIGAILAGSSPELLHQIDGFGKNLGIAFQIKDDILGVFGDEKTVGKSVFSDIREGKNTFLYVHALENANSADRKILTSYYGNDNLTDEQGLIVKDILKKLSFSYCQTILGKYVDAAKGIIPRITSYNEKLSPVFFELCTYFTERNK